MKLPSFQFYPGDWRKDPGVQALSFHDRGVWFEIICLLHESCERGKLLLNGLPMPEDALARLLGLDKQNLTNTLTTLLTFGVAQKCPTTGALMSARMVRDEEIRKIRTECGKKGGNPGLLNQNSNQKPTTGDKQKSTPSSSVSSSASTLRNAIESNSACVGQIPESLEAVLTYAKSMHCGCPEDDARAFFDHFEASSWLDAHGKPVGNWQAKLRSWKNNQTTYRRNQNGIRLGSQSGRNKSAEIDSGKLRIKVIDVDKEEA